MKKVMLVDDEIVIRENIRQCVDWNQEGFIYCGDATDGEMALPLIEQWQPQILITDIKMPFMDGLELASVVRKKFPTIKIIVLSGHDEFHYAQSAIRIGVEDYCLKPVGADDLIALLQRISKQIDEEQILQEKTLYTRDKFLNDLCGGLISTSDAIEAALSFSIHLISAYYVVAVIDVRYDTSISNSTSPSITEQIGQQLEACVPNQLDSLRYKKSRNEYVWIIQGNDLLVLQQMLEELPTKVKTHFLSQPFDVLLGLGEIHERISGIHQSFLEADDNKNLQKLMHQNKINIRLFMNDAEVEHIVLDRAKFITFTKIGNYEQLDPFLEEFCNLIKDLSWHSSMYGIYLLNELTLESIQMAKQTYTIEGNTNEFVATMQLEVKTITNMTECKQYLSKLILWLWQWRSISSHQYGELIMKVKQYITLNYHNNHLSLQEVSKHVGVSPSHLSKVFSQEAKQTLTEFITESRINRAMELLKTTNFKTFEIAFEIGYQDQHYFSNTFKKVTGMTPMEYRKHGQYAHPFSASADGRT